MAIYVVTGKLGAGKTLCSVGRARQYLMQGRRVATNIDLNLEMLININDKKANVTRIPDNPTLKNFEELGQGYEGDYDEEKNGLLLLDECGQFLNTRDFNNPERKALIKWFIHARKKRWDVIFIIQHLNALDKQFREMFAEHVVYCQRTDRLPIPFVGWIFEIIGFSGRFGKIHIAKVRYGVGQHAPKVDTWYYLGNSLYGSYDTEQGYNPNEEEREGNYQLLPPYYTHGRYIKPIEHLKKKAKALLAPLRIRPRWFFLFGLIAGNAITGTAKDQLASVEAPKTSQPAQQTQHTQQQEIDNYRISSSLIGKKKFVFFHKNGEPWKPHHDGYRVHIKDACHAQLLKNDEKIDVFCGPAVTRDERVAAGPQNNPLDDLSSLLGPKGESNKVVDNEAEDVLRSASNEPEATQETQPRSD